MKICPNCKTKMSDLYNNCSVCGCDLSGETEVDVASYSMRLSERTGKKRRTAIIAVLVFVVLFAAGIASPYYFDNKKADNLYDKAYEAIYDTDATYISSDTKNIMREAVEKTSSQFVSDKTKEKIKKLNTICNEFSKLGEIENRLSSGDTSYAAVQFKDITTSEVMNSSRYKDIAPYIKSQEYKQNNKAWASDALRELKNDNAGVIASWSRSNRIVYYTGSVYLSEQYGDIAEVILEDFDGNMFTLEFVYNDGEGSWNDSLTKLISDLRNNKNCIMAVAATEGAYSDRVISYNYKMN